MYLEFNPIFQFYHSAIKKRALSTISCLLNNFNSIIVRLKTAGAAITAAIPNNFNSIIVRLKTDRTNPSLIKLCYFNSIIVRLKTDIQYKEKELSKISILS